MAYALQSCKYKKLNCTNHRILVEDKYLKRGSAHYQHTVQYVAQTVFLPGTLWFL